LYLEGNQIAQLPDDLFLRLPNLKWIDLRNNQITQIPSLGLAKHSSLRYLLLSGNLIRTLPVQLGKKEFFFSFELICNFCC
jgi:Leucine-rich repeat (LRR) protein